MAAKNGKVRQEAEVGAGRLENRRDDHHLSPTSLSAGQGCAGLGDRRYIGLKSCGEKHDNL